MASTFDFTSVKGFKGVTPSGAVKWARVIEPDFQFDDDGLFSINLVFNPEKHADFFNSLSAQLDAAVAEAKEKMPAKASKIVKADLLRDEQDGTQMIRFKSKFKRLDTKTNQVKETYPTIVGVTGALLNPKPLIGNSSVCKVSFYAFPYYMAASNQVGLSLKLNGVQVISLKEYNGSDFTDASEEAAEYEEVF